MAPPPRPDPLLDDLDRLQQPVPGRRLLAWLLFVGIVLGFAVLPIWAAWTGEVEGPRTEARPGGKTGLQAPPPTWGALDVSWNPGPLSSAHERWAGDCQVCHSQPFTRVKDDDCRACHQRTGDHASAQAMEGLEPTPRCASCHRDHNGRFGLAEQNRHYTQTGCAACHQDLNRTAHGQDLRAVSDFEKEHPPFRVQVRDERRPRELLRVRMAEGVRAGVAFSRTSPLKFPHDIHLDREGINSPQGIAKLDCEDCHRPNSDRRGFEPVRFDAHCKGCHEMRFEPTVAGREVPHGQVDQVLSTLREFYVFQAQSGGAGAARTNVPVTAPVAVQRPGQREAPRGSFTQLPLDPKAQAVQAATDLFEKRSCGTCHELTARPGPGPQGHSGRDLPQWQVAEIPAPHPWMPKAEFSHAAHALTDCASCHAAASSKKAGDVLMPGIAVCRECHAGSAPIAQRAATDCAVCHGYHVHEPVRPPVVLSDGRAR